VRSHPHPHFTELKFSPTERKTTLIFAPRTRQEQKCKRSRSFRYTHVNNIYSYRERKAEEKKKENAEMTGEEVPKEQKNK
jgi:hypothetical protein